MILIESLFLLTGKSNLPDIIGVTLGQLLDCCGVFKHTVGCTGIPSISGVSLGKLGGLELGDVVGGNSDGGLATEGCCGKI